MLKGLGLVLANLIPSPHTGRGGATRLNYDDTTRQSVTKVWLTITTSPRPLCFICLCTTTHLLIH